MGESNYGLADYYRGFPEPELVGVLPLVLHEVVYVALGLVYEVAQALGYDLVEIYGICGVGPVPGVERRVLKPCLQNVLGPGA